MSSDGRNHLPDCFALNDKQRVSRRRQDRRGALVVGVAVGGDRSSDLPVRRPRPLSALRASRTRITLSSLLAGRPGLTLRAGRPSRPGRSGRPVLPRRTSGPDGAVFP